MIKVYLRTMLPSVLAFAFSGVYAIVDGFFIGRYVGDAGLASINLAYPMTALLQAVGTGLGLGGAIHMSIALGRGDREGLNQYVGSTISLLLSACLLLAAVLWPTYPALLRLLGAQGQVLDYAADYIRVIILGTGFQVLSTGLAPVFRNLDKALFAMFAMIVGFFTNIILDYLMIGVWGMGMAGAALATILGQGATAVLCIGMLARTLRGTPLRQMKPCGWAAARILRTGISPFGLTLSPNLIIVLVNLAAVRHGGDLAVAAYAVVSYVACVIQLILQGVGDGSQPMISRLIGENDDKSARFICRIAYGIALGAAVSFAGLTILGRNVLPIVFGVSAEAAAMIGRMLMLVAIGYPAIAFVRVTISYFYSVGHDRYAYVLVYGEPLTLAVLQWILPSLIGLDGVWTAIPAAQLLMCALAVCFRRRVAEK